MPITVIEPIELISGREPVLHYLDEIAEQHSQKYPLENIKGPVGLIQGRRMDLALFPSARPKDLELAIWPFLLYARESAKYARKESTAEYVAYYWGFDFNGYRQLIEYFTGYKIQDIHPSVAETITNTIKTEDGLEKLVKVGLLRKVVHTTTKDHNVNVYFLHEDLLRRATSLASELRAGEIWPSPLVFDTSRKPEPTKVFISVHAGAPSQ